MARKAPGKSHRKGLTLLQIADMFPNEDTAREWLIKERWPNGARCPRCQTDNVQSGIKHPTMTHRCRKCPGKPMFSVKTGSVMEKSNLKCRAWAVGIYLFTTNLKGVSSMKLHRELGISQKAAWFMLHRLRLAFASGSGPFAGPVEVDETYFGGKRKNMPNHVREELTGRGAVGKTAVVGAKDRDTNKVAAKAVQSTDAETLQEFVVDVSDEGASVYTDEAAAYEGMDRKHEAVKHSVKEYVRGQVHTNGVESFWSMLKRGYIGTYHKMSPKHLNRYVKEFEGRHNVREADTIGQMGSVVKGMVGKRLDYRTLTADNGMRSGARPS